MIFDFEDLKIYYEDSSIIENNTTNDKTENFKSEEHYNDNKNYNDECPLLFLHGWEGSSLSFKYFYDNISKHRRCLNIDFPPFGNSSCPTRPLTVNNYANIILALLNHLNIKKVDIVAHSFGGRVAIELASKYKVANKLLLTGCAGLKKKNIKKFFKIKMYKFKKFLAKVKLYPKNSLEKLGSDEYKKLSPVMKKTFVNIVNYDQTNLLKYIDVPTLLVWGTIDTETPFYFTKIFKKHIKDCEVIEFKNCSHFAYIEKPKLFLRILFNYFCLE